MNPPAPPVVSGSECPYKGLRPFEVSDADIFFGRVEESEVIISNLLASRLTVLYGPSGVGKSSVLRAGVVAQMRNLANNTHNETGKLPYIVLTFSSWQDDPVTGILNALQRQTDSLEGSPPTSQSDLPADQGGRSVSVLPLVAAIQRLTALYNCSILFILDQFEEYFLYHPIATDNTHAFGCQLAQSLELRYLRANFLISIREDSLAKLDRFKDRIPTIFGNYLRVDHLRRSDAQRAIRRPLNKYNKDLPIGVEPVLIERSLVTAVLDGVRVGQTTLVERGEGKVASVAMSENAQRVEASYLQLVMQRLWNEDIVKATQRLLRAATLTTLGGTERIVRRHLDAVLNKLPPSVRKDALSVLRYLVTPSGTKIALSVQDLNAFSDVPETGCQLVLTALSHPSTRILRPVHSAGSQPQTRYEIYHDVLAPAILDWCRRSRARATFLQWITVILIVAVALVSLAGFTALQIYQHKTEQLALQDLEIERQHHRAEIKQAALYTIETRKNPGLAESVLQPKLADQPPRGAAPTPPTQEPEKVPNVARDLKYSFELDGHALGIWTAHFSHDGNFVITASKDGTAKLWDAKTQQSCLHVLAGHPPNYELNCAEFSGNDKLLVTASDDGTAEVWSVEPFRRQAVLTGHTGAVCTASFDYSGEYVVTAGKDKTARVWSSSTGTPIATFDQYAAPLVNAEFSPIDKFLVAAASEDGILKFWRWRNQGGDKTEYGLPRSHLNTIRRMAFSPNGNFVVLAGLNAVATVWSLESGTEGIPLIGHSGSIRRAYFSHDSKKIVTASNDGTARIFDLANPTNSTLLSGHIAPVWHAVFSRDDSKVATASSDGTARVFDSRGKPLFVLRGHTGIVWYVDFDESGHRLVTAGDDGKAFVWDLK